MTEVSGREPISFAISWLCWNSAQSDLDHGARILHQCFRSGFHNPSLSGAVGPGIEITDRPAGASCPQVHLIDVDDLLYRLILPDNQFRRLDSRLSASLPVLLGSNAKFNRPF